MTNGIDWSLDDDQDYLGCAVLCWFLISFEYKLFRALTVSTSLTPVLLQRTLSVLSAPLAGHARLDSDRFVYIYRSNGLPHWRHRITLQRGDHQTPGQRDFIAIDSPLKKEFELSG